MDDKDAREISYLICIGIALAAVVQLWRLRIKPFVLTVIHPSAADQAPFLTAGPINVSKVDAAGVAVLLALTYIVIRLVLRRLRAARKDKAAQAVDDAA